MKVLVIAQDAQIRAALASQFTQRNRAFSCVDAQWLEQRTDSVVLPSDIGVVINAVSLEQSGKPSNDNEIRAIENLARACKVLSIPLIQLSSNQVFDGDDGSRHRETEQPKPASREGRELLRAEKQVAKICPDHIILRSGLLFSAVGDNILTDLLAQFRQPQTLHKSTAGMGCPVFTGDLARVVSGIVDQLSCDGQARGIFHYHSSDPASQYKFSEAVLAAVSQLGGHIDSQFLLEATDTPDPDWSSPLLNCEKILNTFGIKQLPWRLSVSQAVKQIIQSADGPSP